MSSDTIDLDIQYTNDSFSLSVKQQVPASGCTAIFGPSGAGKSTLLRTIAGLIKPSRGHIRLNDQPWFDENTFTPAHQRAVGFVFQQARLFPHLSVRENIAYAEKRTTAPNRQVPFDEIVDAFALSSLLSKPATELSGGEQQRVALARALIGSPQLLLLDEPLSALDDESKSEILSYLEDLPIRFSSPILYVSHQLQEVLKLSQHTMLMKNGHVVDFGNTGSVLRSAYNQQNNIALSPGAIIKGHVTAIDKDYHLVEIDIGNARLKIPHVGNTAINTAVNLFIDANNVAIATGQPEGLSIRNSIPATISSIEQAHNPAFVSITLTSGDIELRAQITRASADGLKLTIDKPVFALIKSASFQ